jgi:hypothetical protein
MQTRHYWMTAIARYRAKPKEFRDGLLRLGEQSLVAHCRPIQALDFAGMARLAKHQINEAIFPIY